MAPPKVKGNHPYLTLNPAEPSPRGISFDRKGDFQKAIDNFTRAAELEPNNADFYHNR